MVDLLMKYDGKDVVFDRSWYGEICIWPYVYGRTPQLSVDDVEIFREFEDRNFAERYLLSDPNVEAHWRRCVENKEPLNRPQFNIANMLYKKMAEEHDFKTVDLTHFVDIKHVKKDEQPVAATEEQPKVVDVVAPADSDIDTSVSSRKLVKTSEQRKLDQANAINDILSKRIIRFKGEEYDAIEGEVRKFLNTKLGSLFGASPIADLSPDEVQILKLMAQRLKEKEKGK
jgi:hypothetical protein